MTMDEERRAFLDALARAVGRGVARELREEANGPPRRRFRIRRDRPDRAPEPVLDHEIEIEELFEEGW